MSAFDSVNKNKFLGNVVGTLGKNPKIKKLESMVFDHRVIICGEMTDWACFHNNLPIKYGYGL